MEMFEIEDDDNMVDNCMEHHPFANGMPDMKSYDAPNPRGLFFFFLTVSINSVHEQYLKTVYDTVHCWLLDKAVVRNR